MSITSQTFLMDCIEGMKQFPDKHFDLAVVDPPYGINIEQRIFKDGKQWDLETPSLIYFTELFRVSKEQIIWGGNYFIDKLYPTKCFLIWDKKITDKHTFSMSEFAWTSFNTCSKTFYSPPPGNRGFYNIDGTRIHPTQKPIKLYEWIFEKYSKRGQRVLDTHLGSGSSRIAANKSKLNFTGFEIDKEYFDKQEARYKDFTSQLRLF